MDINARVREAFRDPSKRPALLAGLQKQAIAGDYEAVVLRRQERFFDMRFRRSVSPLGVTPDRVAEIGKEMEEKSQKWALAFAERLNSISGIATRVAKMDRYVLLDVQGRSIVFNRDFGIGSAREIQREQAVQAAAQVKQHYGMHYDLIIED